MNQKNIEKLLVLGVIIICSLFFRYSLNIFQGINFVNDIAIQVEVVEKGKGYDNFMSFYAFLIGMIVCLIILLFPLRSFYVKYGMNKKISLGSKKLTK